MTATPLVMMGAPGSPYTRKMRAVLRYRRIPYRMILNFSEEQAARPRPRVPLLPTFYLPDENGEEVAVTDSTPLIRRFEAEFAGRSIRPRDPVLALLDSLLEDYADEWLTKCMFHYRWAYEPDIRKAAAILPLWSRIGLAPEAHEALGRQFAERQIGRLWVVGSNATTAPVIEASYRRFLRRMDARLLDHPFLLGARPGAGDFAALGQLTCLALFDPTPAAIALEESPRSVAWVEVGEELSGLEPSDDDWLARDALPDSLIALLGEVGRVHAPYLLANADALEAGAERVETTLDGRPWVSRPFPYQARCLRWLREEYRALSAADRADADAILSGTGCEALFA
ncbi:MAG: glutathione S-transferase N-terminal domain-containing protein [Myxococcota bacterium]